MTNQTPSSGVTLSGGVAEATSISSGANQTLAGSVDEGMQSPFMDDGMIAGVSAGAIGGLYVPSDRFIDERLPPLAAPPVLTAPGATAVVYHASGSSQAVAPTVAIA